MFMVFLRMTNRISLSFALIAFVAACATTPPRSPSEVAADKKIELAVIQALNDDPNIYARHIEVTVRRGVVTLSGLVLAIRDLFGATQVAASVPGVISVNNQMELKIFRHG
ncbi:MAG: BON domain-containing protein [Betaproteobacteria bacterium]|nr:BON domain-containing protein [Betaproteobacteria bacterium]